MKAIATLIIIFATLAAFSQTSLEKKVFEIVNEYRDSLGLQELKWDTVCQKAAGFQSTYLKSTNGLLSHKNPNKGFETPSDRYKKAGGVVKKQEIKSEWTLSSSVGEIINELNKNYKITDGLYEDKLAKEIFMIWKSSIEHNKAMTDPAAKFAGCSVVATESPGNTKEWKHYNTISIMVLTN